ncbi:MAG: WG repeat-containing protein [Alistipes sp.]|nr:WG repeat-containing protein [Alistipes sp.]
MRISTLLAVWAISIVPTAAAAQELEPKKDDASGKWGYMKYDSWVINPRFERAFSYSEGLACVRLNGKYGFINKVGESVIQYRFDTAWPFSEGLALVSVNRKCGFIDRSGASIIEYRFDDAKPFSDGMAAVLNNGKWGFIDRSGQCVIPYGYDQANAFSEGLASVRRGDTWGFIDKNGKWYVSKDDYIMPFSDYAKRFVERRIVKWQAKGKYEKTVDWQARVTDETRKAKVTELTHEAEKEYIAEMGKTIEINQKLNDYDADNEIFLIKDENFGDLLVPVPIAEAPAFENSFYTMKRFVKYFVADDRLALAEMTLTTNDGKSYTYSNRASLEYFVTNIDYRFAPIEIDADAVTKMQSGEQRIKYAQLEKTVKSDVDVNIPKFNGMNDNTFAVIIANELYKHEENVPYAKTDGESFRNYCIRTLGLPENRVHFCTDATLNEMRMEMNWLRNIGESFGGDAKIIFYYAGHGVSDDSSHSAFLLPTDGAGNDIESGYSTDKLYAQLGALPVNSVTVFLDACFSGAKRDGDMMVASRGVALKPKSSTLDKGNIVVLSATTGDETAALHPDEGHGLFTYFLLKKLQQTQGACTLGELAEYVETQVNRESVVVNKRSQRPTVIYTPSMAQSWRSLKLR